MSTEELISITHGLALTASQIYAVQALFNHSASEPQQREALNVLANYVCKAFARAPESGPATDRWVGRRDVWLDFMTINQVKTNKGNE